MMKSEMANRYLPEVRARAVWMVFKHQGFYQTQVGAIAAIAPKIGCIPQTLREWVNQAEKDSGICDGVTCNGFVPVSLMASIAFKRPERKRCRSKKPQYRAKRG